MSQAIKRVGVVLSGCGYLDGAEIHEATLTLLALDRAGARVVATAPDVPQCEVVDHVRGAAVHERRGVLAEAARICRGNIRPLAEVRAEELDAAIFPGGYGAAKNLSTFAFEGTRMKVLPQVERLVYQMVEAGKPLGFICIAPVIAARLLGERRPRLTIGNDRDTAAALEKMGAEHVDCPVDRAVLDERLKLVSTPAYMLGPSIAQVALGIDRLVAKVLELA